MPAVEAIGVIASDLPRSVAFYGKLGLDLPDAHVVDLFADL
jgi:catechol 2,3-dioxygenase-like lactoylglutathione lyase family enzyme